MTCLPKNSIRAKEGSGLNDLIKLLIKKKLIREKTRLEMHKIRKKKNSYIHPAKTKTDTEKDALEMIESISKILQDESQARP